jgi:hypothetical protein
MALRRARILRIAPPATEAIIGTDATIATTWFRMFARERDTG